MTYKDFVGKIAEKTNLHKKVVRMVLDEAFGAIKDEIKNDGGYVKVPEFGKFYSTVTNERTVTVTNKQTGEKKDVTVPRMRRVKFKVSSVLTKQINS